MSQVGRKAKIWSVVRVTSGNFLEMYNFMVFGYYAPAITMVVFLTEIMPVDVRTSGFALAYSLATAIFGGFTPATCTYLIHISGNRAIPGLWLSGAAACGLIAAILFRPGRSR